MAKAKRVFRTAWRMRGTTAASRGPYNVCWTPDGQEASVTLEGSTLLHFQGEEAKRAAQAFVNRQLQGAV